MEILGIDSKDEVPANYPDQGMEEKKTWIHNLANQLVNRIWCAPSLTEIADVIDAVVTSQEVQEYMDSDDEDEDEDESTVGPTSNEGSKLKGVWCICGTSMLDI